MFTTKSLLTILFFSFFIYSNHFEFNIYFINTLFAIMGIVSLYVLTKKELFVSGFFISIVWFWWVGYSFIYYELTFFIPIVLLAIGILYGILFYLIGLSQNIFYKMGYIFLLSFINPFGFNWFKLELPFINSYLGTSKIEFLIILVSVGLFLEYRKKYQKLSYGLFFLIFSSLYSYNNIKKNNIEKPILNIQKYQTNIKQNKKWNRIYKEEIIQSNLLAIQNAIENKKDLIILPETAFPLVLNRTTEINSKLLELSFSISIVTGSLYEKDGLLYNSTYFYEAGNLQVAHKVVLVPFGEAIPLPEKIRNFINDIFFEGANDYETAKKATTFTIKGIRFRSAICYEATTDEIYKNLDTPYIIVISNNAWFTPSIQPALQNLLIKYYKNKYNLHYFNVTNY
jgi:apolipoprotein N-acyltransferase